MLFLLDADVLITANRDYYPMDRVPEFWDWLVYMGKKGNVKIAQEQAEEIKGGTDSLTQWMKDKQVKEALILEEEASRDIVQRVVIEGYSPDLSDIEFEKLGNDPFLIAHALTDPLKRSIVTLEVSKPNKQRANKKIPDVCAHFGIRTFTTFAFLRELDFSTNWKNEADIG